MIIDFVARLVRLLRCGGAPVLSLGMLATLGGELLAVRAAAKEAVVWIESYEEAIKVARNTGKPIFLEYRCAP